MKPSHAATFIKAAIGARAPFLLIGPTGVGKTSLVEQGARSLGADLIYTDCGTADNTRFEGMPWINPAEKEAKFYPFGDLAAALRATKPTVWFIDDIGWATISVQNSGAHLIHERRTPSGKKLPDCVTIVAATNRRTDKAGVQGLSEAVKSRFCTMINIDVDVDDWCAWAVRTNQPPETVAFIRFRPELLHDFKPTADMVNSPCPRTWASVGKLLTLNGGRLHPVIELEAVKGAVGEGAALEFIGFLKIYRDLPPLDEILLNPGRASIPKEPASLYAVSAGLASRASAGNFDRISQYAQRMTDSNYGEFATLLLRDSVRRDAEDKNRKEKIVNTPAFIKLVSTDLGKLIAGEEV